MLLVVNPKSGSLDKSEDVESLKKHDPVIYETTGKDDLKRIKNLLDEKKHDVVVVIGGDGTVHQVAQLLVNSDTLMAIVPRGSSNGIFNELADRERPLSERSEKSMDVIDIESKYCLHLAGFGLNARIMKESRKYQVRGFWGYAWAFFKSLFGHRDRLYIVNDKKVRASVLLLANGTGYQGKIRINPDAELDDGFFEVGPLRDLQKMKKVVVENPEKEALQIDGEFVGHPKRIAARIMPKAIRLLI